MRRHVRACARAFTLVELLVVIAIIGTLMGLLLPAVQNAREASRSNVCRANLTQLQKAMLNYESGIKEFPGYVNPVGNFAIGVKASWGAMMLPYIERQDLWDQYSRGGQPSAAIETFICPSNPPTYEGVPAMSYLGNAGWYQDEGDVENNKCAPKENPANGVFFDRTRSASMGGVSDVRDLVRDCTSAETDPIAKITFAAIQAQGDGSTNTLMFAESLNALHWTFVAGDTPDEKWHFGFCWDQPDVIAEAQKNAPSHPDGRTYEGFRFINGLRELLPANHVGDKSPNAAIPSSNHPGGVNVAFVGGQVQLLSERIHPTVFAQLMTINRKLSDLRVQETRDRDLPMPDADDF